MKKNILRLFIGAFFFFNILLELSATVVVAGSDFQANTNENGAKIVSNILCQIKRDYRSIDGVLFCGDYTVKLNNKASESESGIEALKSAFTKEKMIVPAERMIFVQGNHDPVGVNGIAQSGANDPKDKKYGVFVINEDDFMWMQGRNSSDGNRNVKDDEDTIKKVAANLEKYLSEKELKKFSGPIFVLSHLPLHYTMRTYNDSDGCYAKYILDVLNNYGKKGLNIIFLFGHNHSHGWDNYLGGSAVCLKSGDEIYVSLLNNREKCFSERIFFTYMNAGYTGYFRTDDKNDGVEKTLSMTVFDISENGSVKIKRYSKTGVISLKAKGVFNTRKNNQEAKLNFYKPDIRIIESDKH